MKIQKYLSLSFVAGIAVSLTGCGTFYKPGYWGAQPYLLNETVRAYDVDKKIKEVEQKISDLNNESMYRKERDKLQDYLKYVSNHNCNHFKGRTLLSQSHSNFGLGSAAALLGAAGGVTSGGLTQVLSVSSGAATGVQSQLGQNYFREKTFEVITRAIDTRRKAIWADIENRRMQDKLDGNYQYNLQGAIADAVEYNGACSLIAGFEELDNSVSMQEDNVEEAKDKQKDMAEEAVLDTQITGNSNLATSSTSSVSKTKGKFRTIGEILATQ